MIKPMLRAAGMLAALAAPAAAGTIHVPQDQPTIQAAVDAAQAGDVILIAAGTYTENVQLTSRSGLTFKAQGDVELSGQGLVPPPVLVDQCSDISFTGFHFTTGAGDGLQLVDSEGISVAKCSFDEFTGDGVHATGSDGVSCTSCTATSCSAGFAFSPAPADVISHDCSVQKCKATTCATGIVVRGDAPHVEQNTITHASSSGISLIDVTAGVITKNKIKDQFGGDGIRVKNAGATTEITNNSVAGSGAGIDVEDSQQLNLRHNKVVFDAFGCIFSFCTDCLGEKNKVLCGDAWVVQGCDHITLSKNTLKGNDSGPGISFTFSDACTADHDKLSHFAGAFNVTGDDDIVTGCSASHVLIGLGMDPGNANTQVSGLKLKLCSLAGMFVDGTGASVTKCKISKTTGDGVRVLGTAATLTGNVVSKAGASGFHLDAGSSGNTLSANTAKGSHDFDLLDESGGANTVNSDNVFKTHSP